MHQEHRLTVALVGQPNVGKSVVMNRLTGAGATVSNYPGTTVELTEADLVTPGGSLRIIDTPGIYSLHSDTEEQRVTHRVLLGGEISMIVNVVDASHLARSLYLTFQLLDLEIPLVIALNQVDMAEEAGVRVSAETLSELTGVPVVPTIATKGIGIEGLRTWLNRLASGAPLGLGRPMEFSPQVESVIQQFEEYLEPAVPDEDGRHLAHPRRALAIHLLEHDRLDEALLEDYPQVREIVETLQEKAAGGTPTCKECFRGCGFCPIGQEHPVLVTCLERSQAAREVATRVSQLIPTGRSARSKLEAALDAPFPGIPILLAATLLSLSAIGWFMDLSEQAATLALAPITRYFTSLEHLTGPGLLRAIVLSIPDGLLMPLSVVLPAMTAVYSVMAILEDTGLLPRIAVAADRLLSVFGVPGQAVIPLVLSFGCKVPAVLGARAVPGKRARLILTVLLSITIPCAATVGAILGLTREFGADASVIYGTVGAVFLALGVLLGRFVPQAERDMALEVPPLRAPLPANVATKLWMRLKGFFSHVLPILILTSIGVRVVTEAGSLSILAKAGGLSTRLLGISGESLSAVAVSAVQRYMGPVMLLNLPLSAREATIAGAMICTSLPCLPTSVLITKENGWAVLAIAYALALATSLTVGAVLNALLPGLP